MWCTYVKGFVSITNSINESFPDNNYIVEFSTNSDNIFGHLLGIF